jgi:hypothetical protein
MFDNVKKHADKEIVYPAHFDTPTGKIGFERVEIDLLKAGRIPASQIKMGKSKKTLVEYDQKSIVIDSLCSWLNITDLTTSRIYRFVIYSLDEYGNKSIPVEISLTPYTTADRDGLDIIPPTVTSTETGAIVEWKKSLTSNFFNFYSVSYEYTDKDNVVQRGEVTGNMPKITIENVAKGQQITLKMNCRIQPKINNVLILDTINWQRQEIISIR